MTAITVLDEAQAISLVRIGVNQSTDSLGLYVAAVNEIVNIEAGAVLAELDSLPSGVTLAAAIIFRHLWMADQQGARANFGGTDQGVVPTPQGFLIPRRAWLLLEPYCTPLGFA